jgi:hypothetical protein
VGSSSAAKLGNIAWTVMAHRCLLGWHLVDPGLVPSTLEELWRWTPSFPHGNPMIRLASEDVELSEGVLILRR